VKMSEISVKMSEICYQTTSVPVNCLMELCWSSFLFHEGTDSWLSGGLSGGLSDGLHGRLWCRLCGGYIC